VEPRISDEVLETGRRGRLQMDYTQEEFLLLCPMGLEDHHYGRSQLASIYRGGWMRLG